MNGASATQFGQFHFLPISSASKNVLEQDLELCWIRPLHSFWKRGTPGAGNGPGCLLGLKWYLLERTLQTFSRPYKN